MLNDDDQSRDKESGESPSIRRSKENTAALKRANDKIKHYLDRLPLEHQRDVVELVRQIERIDRLVRIRITGHVPPRVEVFNENERDRATHLKKRFADAQRRKKIKKRKRK